MEKKGYILASVIFYHNILHRLKVLTPKHWWKITLSSRAARQKKFHKKELFLKSSTETGIQASSHQREHADVTQEFRLEANDASVKFPYKHNIQDFIVSEEILPFSLSLIVAPIEEM